MDHRKRMESLAAELLRHQHLYHVLARPEISDAEYDRLLQELQLLEKRFPQSDEAAAYRRGAFDD